jgi:hypothetical protein
MRPRVLGGAFFLLGVFVLTADPLSGQFGGGKGGFPPGGGGFPQGGGMQPGGGFGGGRGGSMFDPESQWTMLSQMTGGDGNSLDLSKVPPNIREMSRGMAARMGTQPLPESGVVSKAQFLEFAAKNQELARARMGGGGQPGGVGGPQPPGGFPPQAQPGQFGGMPPGGVQFQFGMKGGGGGMTDDDIARRFREGDRNQDGKLAYDEASDRTKQNWAELDPNNRGYVTFDEYKGYIQRRFGGGGQNGNGTNGGGQYGNYGGPNGFAGTEQFPGGQGGPGGPGGDPRNRKAEDFTNVGIRYEKLPPGLPGWFKEMDQDKDGQINMFEWRTVGGKTRAEFAAYDANEDGLIAPLELIRVEALRAERENLEAIAAGEAPARGNSWRGTGQGGTAMGKGGFGGGGGPMMFGGKGGGDFGGKGGGTDGRPTKEERRMEKGGGTDGGGFFRKKGG